MKILTTPKELQSYAQNVKNAKETIALVPTMGALHAGHLSLVEAARKSADRVIVSIFVNPVQFGPNEDFAAYPRTFEADAEKLDATGVDAVFHPAPEAMYPAGYATYVEVTGTLTEKLCGAKRPGHFRGVATVVLKLLLLSHADRAFFGQKDAQQVAVLRRMAMDLGVAAEIVMAPIVREASGLALSSRNTYLSPDERTAALVLSRSLREARDAYETGEKRTKVLKEITAVELAKEPLAKIDYVELYSFPELEEIETIEARALLAVAVYIGKTRLIDNIILGEETCC